MREVRRAVERVDDPAEPGRIDGPGGPIGHRQPPDRAPAPSSPISRWSGKASRMRWAISASEARSASVTRSTVPLNWTFRGWVSRSRRSAPASRAARSRARGRRSEPERACRFSSLRGRPGGPSMARRSSDRLRAPLPAHPSRSRPRVLPGQNADRRRPPSRPDSPAGARSGQPRRPSPRCRCRAPAVGSAPAHRDRRSCATSLTSRSRRAAFAATPPARRTVLTSCAARRARS